MHVHNIEHCKFSNSGSLIQMYSPRLRRAVRIALIMWQPRQQGMTPDFILMPQICHLVVKLCSCTLLTAFLLVGGPDDAY